MYYVFRPSMFREARMRDKRMAVLTAAALTAALFLADAPALRAQEDAAAKTESFGEGRIVRPDGTKIRVSSFDLEAARVSFLPAGAAAASSSLDLSGVKLVQARIMTKFSDVSRAALWGGFAGGVVSLIAANPWGGPWKETWPAIGAGTLAAAAAGAAIVLTVRRYRTIYANPDYAPKPIIKLTMGPVAPHTPGMSLSIAY